MQFRRLFKIAVLACLWGLCFASATVGQEDGFSSSIVITPENASRVTLLATLWHPGDYGIGGAPQDFKYHFSPDGTLFTTYFEETTNKIVRIWDVPTISLIIEIDATINPNNIFYSPNQSQRVSRVEFSIDNQHVGIFYDTNSPAVQVWDLRTGQPVGNFVAGEIPFIFDGGDTRSGIYGEAGFLRLLKNEKTEILDLSTGEIFTIIDAEPCYSLGEFSRYTSTPDGIISPDGYTFISCPKGTLQFLDSETEVIRAEAAFGRNLPPNFMRFSPNSNLLGTLVSYQPNGLSTECRLQLWDTQTGHEVSQLPSLCHDFTFSPDGATIISISLSGSQIMVFGVPLDQGTVPKSVPARVIPSVINVRSQPSADSAVTGYISGEFVISGINPTGQYYYMESHGGGWVNADPAHVDLGIFATKEQLPIRQP